MSVKFIGYSFFVVYFLVQNIDALTRSQRLRYAEDFELFINQYEKSYADEGEKSDRFEAFVRNMERVNEYEARNPYANFGITQFSDQFEHEFQGWLGNVEFQEIDEKCDISNLDEKVPDEFDWQDKGVITSVKNQAPTQNCWAYASCALVEAQYGIDKNQTGLDLSEQELAECDGKDDHAPNVPKECYGGSNTISGPLGYIQENGITDEAHYPAMCGNSTHEFVKNLTDSCPLSKIHPDFPSYRISSFCQLTSQQVLDEEIMKKYLYKHGPLVVAVAAKGWFQYLGGIISDSIGPVDHAVLLTGYGVVNGTPFWNIKNSWGTDMGINGYYRVLRGNNTCSIAYAEVDAVTV